MSLSDNGIEYNQMASDSESEDKEIQQTAEDKEINQVGTITTRFETTKNDVRNISYLF